ncbi:thioredoxin domain-containing protein [Nannocystaceae bacterium ST9]
MSNRLAQSTSPYLLQHADNPVDWYPWGREALERAAAEDKPILLSVGYSACHWCHVMAHESFENPTIAARMNEHFVCIKVDREERPDVDAIYQKVVALMGQGGGWPLTVFLTPDQRPFYGGTYFPPQDRYGRPGFPRVLEALAELWTSKRDEAEKQAASFMDGFADLAKAIDEDSSNAAAERSPVSRAELREAVARLLPRFDPEWGGFGRAPKFPNVPVLELLLAAARLDPSDDPSSEAASALRLTLETMWRGGIYDHLRGGFARYSTDREWLIPHFEKMLYDNALLLGLYADASTHWPELAFLRRVVEETAEYLRVDMRVGEGPGAGAFYSATDADSEGVEGKYFCWTPQQLIDALGEPLAREFMQIHGVTAEGNFEHGMSALHRPSEPTPAQEQALAPARARLLELRYQRVPPLRDEKLLTSWNALTITGLCKAADAAEQWGAPELVEGWVAAAQAAAGALLELHRDAGGRTLRASWQGRGHTRGYLEDVALLGRALLDLHELDLDPRWHHEAERLAIELIDHYARPGGGMFETADDGEALIERTESHHDSPIPSGVAVAIELLARLELGAASGREAQVELERARPIIEATLHRLRSASGQPFALAGLLVAARWLDERAAHVGVRAKDRASARELVEVARAARRGLAERVAIAITIDPSFEHADALVCRGQTCSLPLRDREALREAIVGEPVRAS